MQFYCNTHFCHLLHAKPHLQQNKNRTFILLQHLFCFIARDLALMCMCVQLRKMSVSSEGDSVCASVTQLNVTSCDNRMSYTVDDLTADTNYTTVMTASNVGGPSRPSYVSVITEAHGQIAAFACNALTLHYHVILFGWPEWLSGRTSVSGQRFLPSCA